MKQIILQLLVLISLGYPARAQVDLVVPNNEPKTQAALQYHIENNFVRTEHAVVFAKGTATLLPESDAAIETIKKFLDDKSYVSLLRVEGHTTCGSGDQALSEARAMAVCKKLIAEGVDCKRLLAVGFGCSKPIMDVHNELNARIEFVLVALKGRVIGGMPVDGGGKVAGEVCGD
ncbi:MAG: OmpA family protein [Bacteroidetes bacterium]|nr:OmpA family protein [Bacteroidota bacterium]